MPGSRPSSSIGHSAPCRFLHYSPAQVKPHGRSPPAMKEHLSRRYRQCRGNLLSMYAKVTKAATFRLQHFEMPHSLHKTGQGKVLSEQSALLHRNVQALDC